MRACRGGSIRALQNECGGDLTFVFRHFPLEEIHAHACARATSAAAELDPDRFVEDLTAPQTAERIGRDQASGERSRVEGTPTFTQTACATTAHSTSPASGTVHRSMSH